MVLLSGTQVFILAITIAVTLLLLVSVVANVATRRVQPLANSELDTDALAEQIRQAIKEATVDLLGALESIGQDTTRIAHAVDQLVENAAEHHVPDIRVGKY